jgi:hypothetical protein
MEPDAKQLAMDLKDEHGFVNVDKLCDRNPRLGLVRELADRYKFHHWELEYADLFERRGGFDLTIGNPPWVKVEWDEQGLLSDYEPKISVRDWSKTKTTENVESIIDENRIRDAYLAGYEAAEATQAFQNAFQNYPLLKGMQSNSYKCFLPQGWMIGKEEGITAFLHPDGVFDDPKGRSLRREIYGRILLRLQFHNEFRLFSDVHHTTTFGLNIYRSERSDEAEFRMIANLFSPSTVDDCFAHDGSGVVPGIKNDDHEWSTRGHADRIVPINSRRLRVLADLYDGKDVGALEARLPAIHSKQAMSVLNRLSAVSGRLIDLGEGYRATELWHETNAQEDGLISWDTHFPEDSKSFVVSGPHFFVGTPLNKTPNRVCDHRNAYEEIDLTEIPKDYLPRTNFQIDCSEGARKRNTPSVSWGEGLPVTDHYCFANRRMFHPNAERSLIPCILPPVGGGLNTVFVVCFESKRDLLVFTGLSSTTISDFYIKNSGKSDLRADLASRLPLPQNKDLNGVEIRTLLLNSLTTHYADLWEDSWQDAFTNDTWTKDDPRLPADTDFSDLTGTWDWDTPLRTRYARRQALVELDVLAAQALGLTLEELQTIYRVQFPVLRKYEQNTWYDQNGRIIYTKNRGLPGVGFKSKKWKEVKDMTSGTVEQTVEDDTQPGGPVERTITYEAPFTKCDREADYERAWGVFESRT